MNIKAFVGIVILTILSLGKVEADEPQLSFTFTTVSITGADYAPQHVFAVWIKDSNGDFVNSQMVYAQERIGYLEKFNASSGGFKVDAVTGATLIHHVEHTATWNMKNFLGSTVANGDYTLCFEMSSGGHGNENPFYTIAFTLDGQSFTTNPVDQTYLKTMTLTYSNGSSTAVNDVKSEQLLSIFPNPATASSNIVAKGFTPGSYTLELFDMSGKVIYKQPYLLSGSNQEWSLPASEKMQQGQMYILRMRGNNEDYQLSFIYKNL